MSILWRFACEGGVKVETLPEDSAQGVCVAFGQLEPAAKRWANTVRFSLVDRITELTEGKSISAVKALTLSEEYLADHFPRFPVMPGVLMLEAMYQTSAWLVRQTDRFQHTMVVLREARNVKFSNFVEPGQVLQVQATILKHTDDTTTLKAEAVVEGKTAVSARLVLERYNLADRYPSRAATDDFMRRELQEQFAILCGSLAGDLGA